MRSLYCFPRKFAFDESHAVYVCLCLIEPKIPGAARICRDVFQAIFPVELSCAFLLVNFHVDKLFRVFQNVKAASRKNMFRLNVILDQETSQVSIIPRQSLNRDVNFQAKLNTNCLLLSLGLINMLIQAPKVRPKFWCW